MTKTNNLSRTAKWWLIARREIVMNILKPSFLFGTFGVPFLTVGIMIVIAAVAVDSEENVERVGVVGYVDLAGVLEDPIEVPEQFIAYESAEAARAALDANELGAYFVIQPEYRENGAIQVVSQSDVPEALTDMFDDFLIANIARGLDPQVVERLVNPVENTIRTLDTGRELQSSAVFGLFITPFIFVFVFMIASQTSSSMLMGSIVEEKSNRLMEILVTSVTPFQLLFGKLIGLGVLGLFQVAVWIIIGFVVLTVGQAIPFLKGVTIPIDMLVVGSIYFVLGYFLTSSLMAGIGVIVGSEQESRQYAGIFSLLFVIPFFLIFSFFTDPEGPVVTFLCLFPFTSPISVILRMAFGSMPLGLLALSITILVLTTIVMTWASARIFRWALLLYGKRPSVRELLNVLRRRSPTLATSAAAATTRTGE